MRRLALVMALGCAAVAGGPAGAESLDDVLAASLAHSPALAAARAREEAADAAVEHARALRMPIAQVQGQIGVGRIDPQGFFGLSADEVVPRTAQVTVDLPLYTGGRIDAARAQAEGGRAVAASAARSAELALRVEVVRVYSQALAAQEEIRSYAKLGEALGEALRQARLKFEAGEGTSTEIAQAQARLSEAEAGLAGAQGMFDTALSRLALLAGREVVPSEDLPPPPPLPVSAEEAVQLALSNNPEVEKARQAARVARGAVAAARAEGLPTVGAYAEGASVRDQFFPDYKADSASVGLRASWTFFSGGQVSAKVRQAAAEASAAEADADAAALEVESRARQSFAGVIAARAVVAAAEARASAAEEALRGTRLEVSVGAKPQLALLDAEREAIAAGTARIAAESRLLVAVYTLQAVIGLSGDS